MILNNYFGDMVMFLSLGKRPVPIGNLLIVSPGLGNLINIFFDEMMI